MCLIEIPLATNMFALLLLRSWHYNYRDNRNVPKHGVLSLDPRRAIIKHSLGISEFALYFQCFEVARRITFVDDSGARG